MPVRDEIPDSEDEPLTSSPVKAAHEVGETATGTGELHDAASVHREVDNITLEASRTGDESSEIAPLGASEDAEPPAHVHQTNTQPNAPSQQDGSFTSSQPVMHELKAFASSKFAVDGRSGNEGDAADEVPTQTVEHVPAEYTSNEQEQVSAPTTTSDGSGGLDDEKKTLQTLTERPILLPEATLITSSLEEPPEAATAQLLPFTECASSDGSMNFSLGAQSVWQDNVDMVPSVVTQTTADEPVNQPPSHSSEPMSTDQVTTSKPQSPVKLLLDLGTNVGYEHDSNTDIAIGQQSQEQAPDGSETPDPVWPGLQRQNSASNLVDHDREIADIGRPTIAFYEETRMDVEAPLPTPTQSKTSQTEQDSSSTSVDVPIPTATEVDGPDSSAVAPLEGTSIMFSTTASQEVTMEDHLEEESHANETQQQVSALMESVPAESKQAVPAKTQQEVTLAELQAQRTALVASLAALENVQELVAEDESSDLICKLGVTEPTDSDIMAAANKIVKKHIKLLHEYNEIKDVGQGLMGLIADSRGVRIVEVQDEFGVNAND